MKRIISSLIILFALASCEEFQPVFTGEYDNPDPSYVYTDADFGKITPISEVKAMYQGDPVDITGNVVIKGQVVTSDKEGNIYKSFYIQDETAGIEIKIGKNGLYNEYKQGQWVYVDCNNLTVGSYEGMVQIGYKDPTGEYETSYLEHSIIIDSHVFKGEMAPESERIKPVTISGNEIHDPKYLGTLVTIEDLSYYGKIFCICYINPNILEENGKKDNDNRFFLDEEDPDNWGIDTWAMSETLFYQHVLDGDFDNVEMNDGVKVSERKHLIVPTPYTMNQYFEIPGLSGNKRFLQVRSSGYAKFSDTKIPSPVLEGKETLTVTGILTTFNGDMQFTLIDLDGVTKKDGSPWYDENRNEIL